MLCNHEAQPIEHTTNFDHWNDAYRCVHTTQNQIRFGFLPQLPLISQSDRLICVVNLMSPDGVAHVNVSRNAFFSSRSEKNIFLIS